MFSIFNAIECAAAFDKGGIFDVAKASKSLIHNNKKFTYIATGHCRDVYISSCGTWVIKLPKDGVGISPNSNKLPNAVAHNIHEYNCYVDAPEPLKTHIAKCELLPNGALLQEFVRVIPTSNYLREFGYRADGTFVIFDCDVFLDTTFNKPESGYRYFEAFNPIRKALSKEASDYLVDYNFNKHYAIYVTDCGYIVKYYKLLNGVEIISNLEVVGVLHDICSEEQVEKAVEGFFEKPIKLTKC